MRGLTERGGGGTLLVSSIFNCGMPMSLMDSCQSWGGEETAGPRERERNLLQTKQCVSSAALTVPV